MSAKKRPLTYASMACVPFDKPERKMIQEVMEVRDGADLVGIVTREVNEAGTHSGGWWFTPIPSSTLGVRIAAQARYTADNLAGIQAEVNKARAAIK